MTPELKATGFVNRMIVNESHGPNGLEPAMRRIERDYGIGYWTLDRLRKGRVKSISVDMFRKVRAAYLAHCEFKLKSLAHEIEMERACGNDWDSDLLDKAHALLSEIEAKKAQ